jgi:hypothetical protein
MNVPGPTVEPVPTAEDSGRSASARAMVERQLKHMVRLIDDLMDVSRSTQGRLQLRQERSIWIL